MIRPGQSAIDPICMDRVAYRSWHKFGQRSTPQPVGSAGVGVWRVGVGTGRREAGVPAGPLDQLEGKKNRSRHLFGARTFCISVCSWPDVSRSESQIALFLGGTSFATDNLTCVRRLRPALAGEVSAADSSGCRDIRVLAGEALKRHAQSRRRAAAAARSSSDVVR